MAMFTTEEKRFCTCKWFWIQHKHVPNILICEAFTLQGVQSSDSCVFRYIMNLETAGNVVL